MRVFICEFYFQNVFISIVFWFLIKDRLQIIGLFVILLEENYIIKDMIGPHVNIRAFQKKTKDILKHTFAEPLRVCLQTMSKLALLLVKNYLIRKLIGSL